MGYIYLYTGTGAGKTTNGLGLALRSVGHERNVVIIQFLKWRKDIGEYRIKDRLKPYYSIYQFGSLAWLGEKKSTAEFGGEIFDVEAFTEEDRELVNQGLEFVDKVLREEKPHLLVLDEINLVAHWGLLDVDKIIDLLDELPDETDVVLTGRYTPRRLIEKADFVNVIESIKAPKKFELTEGIQY